MDETGHDWTIMPLLMALTLHYGISSDRANNIWVSIVSPERFNARYLEQYQQIASTNQLGLDAQADFGSDLAFEVYVDPRMGMDSSERICRVLYHGKVLHLTPGDANGLCGVRALRNWLEAEGLLLRDVKRWNTLCNTASSTRST